CPAASLVPRAHPAASIAEDTPRRGGASPWPTAQHDRDSDRARSGSAAADPERTGTRRAVSEPPLARYKDRAILNSQPAGLLKPGSIRVHFPAESPSFRLA